MTTISIILSDCESLIRKMLVVDPLRRHSLSQIKRHRWMSIESPPEQNWALAGTTTPTGAESVNEQILRLMQSLGVDPVKTKESVTHQRYDHHAAIYYLLLERRTHLTASTPVASPSFPAPTNAATTSTDVATGNKPIRRPTSWTHRYDNFVFIIL